MSNVIELPEYGNAEQVRKAIKSQKGRICAARANLDMEHARMAAIRSMCEHDWVRTSHMGESGRRCSICEKQE